MTRLTKVEETFTAANQFSGWLDVDIGDKFSISIGTGIAADVTSQISYDGGSTIYDIKSFTLAVADSISEFSETMPEAAKVRAGVKTGDYTSGTATVRLGRG